MEEPHILLVKQFRPPVGKYTIEMPAGLIDPGEIPEQVRVRPSLTRTECTLARFWSRTTRHVLTPVTETGRVYSLLLHRQHCGS
jgi:hypothetical protein